MYIKKPKISWKAIQKAYEATFFADHNYYAVGASVSKQGRTISTGFNQYKTHPLQEKYKRREKAIFLHAEIHALVRARSNANNADMVIVRRLKNGYFGNSKPCPGCMQAIVSAGIRNIFFYEDESFVCINVQDREDSTTCFEIPGLSRIVINPDSVNRI